MTLMVILAVSALSCGAGPAAYEARYLLNPDFTPYEQKVNHPLTDDEKKEALRRTIEIMLNRIDMIGAAKIGIENRSDGTIELRTKFRQTPDVFERAVLVSGYLEFRHCNEVLSVKAGEAFRRMNIDPVKLAAVKEYRDGILASVSASAGCPSGIRTLFMYGKKGKSDTLYPLMPMCLENKVILDSRDIHAVYYQIENGNYRLNFRTTGEGKEKLAEATASAFTGKRLAIISNDQIRIAPVIMDQILTGQVSITGEFVKADVDGLQSLIQGGAYPIRFSIVSRDIQRIGEGRGN
jgi:preprotein translocase subunit SecD